MTGPAHRALPVAARRRPFTPGRLAYLYRVHIVRPGREDHFLAWSSFTLAFVVVRFITHSIRAGRYRRIFRNVQGRGGRHIHHLVFGIFGLLGVGYFATALHPQRRSARGVLAVLYGVSAALSIDEFALWLDLADVYWSKQGRVSVDAAVITAGVMGAGGSAWKLIEALGRDTVRLIEGRTAEGVGDVPPRPPARP